MYSHKHNPTDFAATILVVDDDPADRDLIVRWLSKSGYACVEASCADDAWELLEQVWVPLVTM